MTEQEFWENQKTNNAYDKYKDEVKYDFDITAKMPISFKLDNGEEVEIQHWDFMDNEAGFEEDVDSIISNEDWLHGPFDDIALGRVYIKLTNSVADDIELQIGISLKECEEPEKVTIESLTKDTIALLEGILDNVEQQHFSNQESENGPSYIKLIGDVNNSQIKIVQNKNINEDYIKKTLTDIDKILVKESVLNFTNGNNSRTITLNDDGIVECLENNKWINSQPFSRTKLEKVCRETLDLGYTLTLKESQIKTKDGQVIDTDKEKENIEQAKEEVEDIKQSKEEVDTQIEEIFGDGELVESKEPEFSDKVLTVKDCKELSEEQLTPEQLEYTNNVMGSLDNLKKELNTIFEITGLKDEDTVNTLQEILKYYKR